MNSFCNTVFVIVMQIKLVVVVVVVDVTSKQVITSNSCFCSMAATCMNLRL